MAAADDWVAGAVGVNGGIFPPAMLCIVQKSFWFSTSFASIQAHKPSSMTHWHIGILARHWVGSRIISQLIIIGGIPPAIPGKLGEVPGTPACPVIIPGGP